MLKLVSSILIAAILTLVVLTGCSMQMASRSVSPTTASVPPTSKYAIDFPAPAGGLPEVTFELTVSQSDLPAQLTVYRMLKPEITAEYFDTLVAKFGMNGEIKRSETGGFSIKDSNSGAYLDVYGATGTVMYTMDSKLYPKEKPVLPSDEEAKVIATDFLSETGLLLEGDVASTVSKGGTSAAYGTAHLLVGFTHAFERAGPGAKCGVRIGNNGEVVAVFVNPTNPLKMPVEEGVPIKPMEQAVEQMQTSYSYLLPLEARKVKITGAKIAYWLEPIDKGQEYIVPVYIFKGRCFDQNDQQTEGSFQGYAQAVY
jgi:hypothetical protein